MKKIDHTTCPIAKVADLLSDTWTMLIIRDLIHRPMRYNELLSSLQGVSTRTLILKLKRLEEQGIVQKNDPFYQLTLKGEHLHQVIDAMALYGQKYLKD
ncbi:MAG: helix-turn-helix domain-containing protein [bacterium]